MARDAVGNEGRHSLTVLFEAPAGLQLRQVSGDGQAGLINQPVSAPLVVQVTDQSGQPVAGRMVRFAVTRNNAVLRAQATDTPQRLLDVPTDGHGRAAALLTLGDTAGAGNNRVTATVLGVAGSVEFCATAQAEGPDKILVSTGFAQKA